MADINEILGMPKESDNYPVMVDGSCDVCFYWIAEAFYWPKDKKLSLTCVNGHEWEIPNWEMSDG